MLDNSLKIPRAYSARIVVAIAATLIFTAMQSLSVVHASQFGVGDHEHSGQRCVIASVLSGDDDLIIPVGDLEIPAFCGFELLISKPVNVLTRASFQTSARAPPQ